MSRVTTGPLVSIIVVSNDDRASARLLQTAGRTTYRPLDVIVVKRDPAAPGMPGVSSAPDVAGRTVVVPPEADWATAVNAAVDASDGEFVCLIDPSVAPMFDDWLGHLVEAISGDVVAAGPVLIRRPERGLVRARQRHADRSVASRGIVYERTRGLIRPGHAGRGGAARGAVGTTPIPVPAASLACLLIRRSHLQAIGGVPAGYRSAGRVGPGVPYADADLGARIRASGGAIACDPRSVAWCMVVDPTGGERSVATRPARDTPDGLGRDRWITDGDAATFLDHWGPRMTREVLLDVIEARGAWSPGPLRVAVIGRVASLDSLSQDHATTTVVRAASMDPRAARALDVDIVIVGPSDADVDIRDVPPGIIRIAIVDASPPADLDEFDLVAATSEAVRARVEGETIHPVEVIDLAMASGVDALRRRLIEWVQARRFGIRIGAAGWKTAHLWGDYHFARALQRHLERQGHPSRLRLLDDWASEAAAADDATIHLFGLRPAHNRPSQVDVLWHISHPDLATSQLYERYDHVFVASDTFATEMRGRVGVPVEPLHQATDHERFRPVDGGPRHDLLYVANHRAGRPVLDQLLPTDLDLAVYGRGWEEHGLDPRHHLGTHVENDELPRLYGAAAITLNDTWEDMRAAGFISNRIYDALASGGFVLSDDVVGIDAEFDAAVPVYRDAASLRAAIDRYLAAPEERTRLAAVGRAAVLARHTFEQRATTILSRVHPMLKQHPAMIAPADDPQPDEARSSKT